jgi:hypothetical protein
MDVAGFFAQDYPWVAAQFFVLLIQAVLTIRIIRANAALAHDTHNLAMATREQVKASLESVTLADRHHQETLAPIVVPTLGLHRSMGQGGYQFSLKGILRNIGGGPALAVEVRCTPVAVSETVVWNGVLGAGSEVALDFSWIVSREPNSDYQERDYPFGVTVDFRNIFNVAGSYVATSHSGEARHLRQTQLELPTVKARIADSFALPEPIAVAGDRDARNGQ